jgi:hypothetical protein
LAVLYHLETTANVLLRQGMDRAAARGSTVSALAIVFAQLNPRPIPADRVRSGDIIRLPDERG